MTTAPATEPATPSRPTADAAGTPADGAGAPADGAGRPADAATVEGLSFPRLMARTGSFRFGSPRVVGFANDGATVVFLRSRSGTDRAGLLWSFDVASGTERLLADPAELLAAGPEQLSDAERSRRERSRETHSGIVSAALDATRSTVAFTLSSRLFVLTLDQPAGPVEGTAAGAHPGSRPESRELPTDGPVVDPRPDPTGHQVAYCSSGSLRLTAVDGSGDRVLVAPDSPTVSWAVAEFAAAEEMGRARGYWWSPDGSALLAARVEESAVSLRTVADPSRPTAPARAERYPFAGTANAEVSVWWVPVDGAPAVRLDWDSASFPYLAALTWTPAGPPLLAVQSRDQRELRVLSLDVERAAAAGPDAGRAGAASPPSVPTNEVGSDHDDTWIELFAGVPAWLPGGRVLTVVADPGTDTYRLAADGVAFSPAGLQIEAVLDVGRDDILAVVQSDPLTSDIAVLRMDGTARLLTGPRATLPVDDPVGPGRGAGAGGGAGAVGGLDTAAVHSARRQGATLVIERSGPDRVASTLLVTRADGSGSTIASLALAPSFVPAPEVLLLGEHELRSWLFLPADRPAHPAPGSLPVLLAPYGGPGAAMVRAAARRAVTEQWWADQGFAVLVVDNRGTPGRGPAFDRAVHHDFAGITLDDQVEALAAAAVLHPELDLSRVAIHGWSFGGYLSALAVLRRPDVFAAAVAGAPPTDWRLYDTHYTERYLGHPDTEPEVYARNGLVRLAPGLERPLMIIHGLADDNVLVAHSLELSRELLRAGRPHTFLPLSGVTHMTSDEDVAENLLLLQLDFLRTALGLPR